APELLPELLLPGPPSRAARPAPASAGAVRRRPPAGASRESASRPAVDEPAADVLHHLPADAGAHRAGEEPFRRARAGGSVLPRDPRAEFRPANGPERNPGLPHPGRPRRAGAVALHALADPGLAPPRRNPDPGRRRLV